MATIVRNIASGSRRRKYASGGGGAMARLTGGWRTKKGKSGKRRNVISHARALTRKHLLGLLYLHTRILALADVR